MYRNLTKLLLAGVVAVALLALGITLFPSPAWAGKIKAGKLPLDGACTTGQIARWDGDGWECSDEGVADVQAQLDNLALLASRQASVFIFVTSSTHDGDFGGVAHIRQVQLCYDFGG